MLIAFYRTVILYVLVIAVLRFTGKRQIGELQPSELVTTILISNIAAIPIENNEKSLISGIIPIAVIACMEIILSLISLKSQGARDVITGKSKMIIDDGRIDQKLLKDMRLTVDDLMEQLRSNGIFDLNEVLYAILETNGKLSVLPKYQYRPLNNVDSGNKCNEKKEKPSVVVISDGSIVKEWLLYCNLTEEKLESKLIENKLTLKEVFIMTCNPMGDISIIKKEKAK
ncbi:MAG: DUF421 domain-containing protein [Oscillospiraceae bacterium]